MRTENLKDKIEGLRLESRKLEMAAQELEERERAAESRPILRKSVGKCFKYNNSYGDETRWPLYARIVSFDEREMTFNTVEFEQTSRKNIIEVRFNCRHNFGYKDYFYHEGSGWTPITRSEYERARKAAFAKVKKLIGDEAERA